MIQITEKSRTHPLPRTPARSPAVGPAHSHATPHAFRCPRARDAPTPKATPDTPPPRTTATFPGPKGREPPKGREGCAVRHSREALESAAGICRKARQRNTARRGMVEFPEKTELIPCRGP